VKIMEAQPQLHAYLLLAGMWTGYCALHSLMITPRVVRGVQTRFPPGRRYYRLVFNLVSVLTLIPVVIYSYSLQTEAVWRWAGALRPVQAAMLLAGLGLVAAGAAKYDFRQFLGLAQLADADTCRGIGSACALDTSGILGVVRHPWYTAVVLMLWARDMDPAALVVNGVLTLYIGVGTVLEERKLVGEFGQAYRDYQQRVSMFLPVRWLQAKMRGIR
jgi:protein-S-isoprenylcysteine O-methyltransferase Ste14